MAVLQAIGVERLDRERSPRLRRDLLRAGAVGLVWLTDNALLVAACYSATFLRFGNLVEGNAPRLAIALVASFLLAALSLGCYNWTLLHQPFRSARKIIVAVGLAVGLLFAIAFAFQVGPLFSRLETGITIVAAEIYLAFGRLILAVILARQKEAFEPVVLVVGRMRDRTPVGGVTVLVPQSDPDPGDPRALEKFSLQVRHADRVVLAFDDPIERNAWIRFVRLFGIDAEIIEPQLQQIEPLALGSWHGVTTLVVARGPLKIQERAAKRSMDLVLGISFALLSAPLFVVLMGLIKINSPGPVFFAQSRVGQNNRRYLCYKFRTMHQHHCDPNGDRSASRDDDRVTNLGKFLRWTSLDELPQLWNVIKGEMSLVGPRPHALGSTAQGTPFWEVEPGYWTRHAMKPGITGLAQIRGLRGGNVSRSELEQRLAADIEYINNWSLWADLKILIKTFGVMFHRNAY